MAVFFLEVTGPTAWQLAAYLQAGRREFGRDGLPTPEIVDVFTKGMSGFAARECPELPTIAEIGALLDHRRMDALLLSVQRAAEVLGLGRRTVARMVSNGDLPSVKVGGRTLIRRSDLEEYAAGLPPAPMAARVVTK